SAPEVRPDRPLERSRLIDNLVRSPKRTIPPALCWTPWKLSKPVIPSVDPTTSLAELKDSITESLWLRRVRAILLESHQEIPRLRVPYVQYKGSSDYNDDILKAKSLEDFEGALVAFQHDTEEMECRNRNSSSKEQPKSLP